MKKVLFFLLFLHSWCFAATVTPQQLLSTSQQLVVVSTQHWKSTNGYLQRFERGSTRGPWKPIGNPFPVVIGKNGVGWGRELYFKYNQSQAAIKQEGDSRTPMGIYAIGPTFGFADQNNNKDSYIQLTDTSVCVDDSKSAYYNKIIDSKNVIKKDWNSGETMRQIPQYKLGAVVQYNTNPTIPGAGSCIFMHIWKSPTEGTAGCIAMEEQNLQTILNWLDFKKIPIIAILTNERSNKNQMDIL